MFNEKQAVGRCSQEVTHRRRTTFWAPGALTLIRKLSTDKAQASLNAPLWTLIWPILRPWTLYSFLRAAITKYHKLSGLKQQVFSLRVLEARSLKLRHWQDHTLRRSWWRILPVCSSFWCWPASLMCLGLWTYYSNFCLCLHVWLCDFSLCDYVFLSNFPSSYKDTNHIRLKATQIQYDPYKDAVSK